MTFHYPPQPSSVGICNAEISYPALVVMERLSAIALAHAMTFDEVLQIYERIGEKMLAEWKSGPIALDSK